MRLMAQIGRDDLVSLGPELGDEPTCAADGGGSFLSDFHLADRHRSHSRIFFAAYDVFDTFSYRAAKAVGNSFVFASLISSALHDLDFSSG